MSGLGIAAFLKHSNEQTSRGQWLREWRKNGKGEITIWLHTRAPIVPAFTHQIPLLDEYTDKESGKQIPVLRWPRFASPDPEIVHRSQFFREDDGRMRVPPDRDPFLLLREWLRGAEEIGLEDPIFAWINPKDKRQVVWTRGELSGLVKRGRQNYGNSLDTKIEYVYVVVDNDNVSDGPCLMREGKLLSQKIAEVIKHQQKQWGDVQGDPLQHPYGIQLVAEDAAVPLNAYKAYKNERAEFSDEVWEQISGDEYPDSSKYGEPQDGDMEKIRDAFESAAQVDLPLDAIFSEDSDVRRDVAKRAATKLGTSATIPSGPRASRAAQAREKSTGKPGGAQAQTRTRAAASSATAGAAPPASSGASSRRKKAAPAQPPKPAVETIPCDDCGHQMLATDTKCAGCGAEYEPIETTGTELPPPPAAPKATGKPSAGGKPKPGGVTKPAASVAPSSQPAGQSAENCWSCGVALDQANPELCPSCGIEQSDDLPFAWNESDAEVWMPTHGIGERWHAKRTSKQIV